MEVVLWQYIENLPAVNILVSIFVFKSKVSVLEIRWVNAYSGGHWLGSAFIIACGLCDFRGEWELFSFGLMWMFIEENVVENIDADKKDVLFWFLHQKVVHIQFNSATILPSFSLYQSLHFTTFPTESYVSFQWNRFLTNSKPALIIIRLKRTSNMLCASFRSIASDVSELLYHNWSFL